MLLIIGIMMVLLAIVLFVIIGGVGIALAMLDILVFIGSIVIIPLGIISFIRIICGLFRKGK